VKATFPRPQVLPLRWGEALPRTGPLAAGVDLVLAADVLGATDNSLGRLVFKEREHLVLESGESIFSILFLVYC
jgi:hypothetical protein